MNAKAIQFIVIVGLTGTAMLAALGNAPEAYAEVVNHSGAICKNYNASDATKIAHFPRGTANYSASNALVTCPLVRATVNSNGATAYVDIRHDNSGTTWCMLSSYTWNDTLLGNTAASWTGSGFHEFTLYLGGPGRSTKWSDYSVMCSIPGNSMGLVMGIDLVEY